MRVLIPDEVYFKIKEMTKHYSSVEWVGTIFYKIEGGIIRLVDLCPLKYEHGASVGTNFTEELDYVRYMVEKDLTDCLIGRIHSHNNMGVFHSGTDENDFEEYAKSDVTISIVVNNKMEFYGKIGFPIQNEIVGKKAIYKEELYFEREEKEVTDEIFLKQLKKVLDEKKKADEKAKAKRGIGRYYGTGAANLYSKVINTATSYGGHTVTRYNYYDELDEIKEVLPSMPDIYFLDKVDKDTVRNLLIREGLNPSPKQMDIILKEVEKLKAYDNVITSMWNYMKSNNKDVYAFDYESYMFSRGINDYNIVEYAMAVAYKLNSEKTV